LEALVKMLAEIMFAIFLEVVTFSGTYFKSDADFLDGDGEAIFDTTSLCGLFQVSSIFYPSFMVPKDRAEDLRAAYPQGHFW
jgi:hypothetical protein